MLSDDAIIGFSEEAVDEYDSVLLNASSEEILSVEVTVADSPVGIGDLDSSEIVFIETCVTSLERELLNELTVVLIESLSGEVVIDSSISVVISTGLTVGFSVVNSFVSFLSEIVVEVE